MKFNRSDLLPVLKRASAVAPKKPIQPITGNVLILPIGDEKTRVEIIATDLKTAIRMECACEGATPICTSAYDLLAQVAGLDTDEVEIAVFNDGGKVAVVSGGYRFEMPNDNPRDFPAVPKFDSSKASGIDAKEFSSLIGGVAYAASNDLTRANLAGLHIVVEKSRLVVFATDGHRMAVRFSDMKATGLSSCTIPTPSVNAILGSIEGAESCKVLIADGSIEVFADGCAVSTKLAETAQIPYAQVIPSPIKTPAIVAPETIAPAIRRALLVRAENVLEGISVSPGKLTIKRADAERTSLETVECTGGDERTVRLNMSYLLEAFDSTGDSEVELHIVGELDPVSIRSRDGKQIHIIMPKAT